jgi:hypothetical protein
MVCKSVDAGALRAILAAFIADWLPHRHLHGIPPVGAACLDF